MNYYENLLKPLIVPSHRSTPSSLLYCLAAYLPQYPTWIDNCSDYSESGAFSLPRIQQSDYLARNSSHV